MRIIEGATFLNRKETKENSSSCAIVLHNQTWPTRFGRKHPPHIHFYPRPCLIVLQRFGFRSLCCGELKPWYRLMPRYPTFTGICGLVLFHQLWVSQLSVRVFVVSQLKTIQHENPNRRSLLQEERFELSFALPGPYYRLYYSCIFATLP